MEIRLFTNNVFTSDHISIVTQLTERQGECNIALYLLFVDYKKALDLSRAKGYLTKVSLMNSQDHP